MSFDIGNTSWSQQSLGDKITSASKNMTKPDDAEESVMARFCEKH